MLQRKMMRVCQEISDTLSHDTKVVKEVKEGHVRGFNSQTGMLESGSWSIPLKIDYMHRCRNCTKAHCFLLDSGKGTT